MAGLMRLGLSGPATTRGSKQFKYEVDGAGNVVAFDKSAPRATGPFAREPSAAPAGVARGRAAGPGSEPFVPAKFALAGQKLTFSGYFVEAVPDSPTEATRQRRLTLTYHLEDDTLGITEVAARNDGMVHGTYLKRMKVPGVTVDSLVVGEDVEIFARPITIYACDEFTRKFYDGVDAPQPPDQSPGKDAWTEAEDKKFARNDPTAYHGVRSSAITRFIEAERGSTRSQSFKKDVKKRFIEYDGLVFRFYVMWADKYADPPTKYFYWLSYFMATEEVEIVAAKGKKDGAGWATLLSKMRLPKFTLLGDDRMRSVEAETGDEDYYHEDDLLVGSKIHVFGRDMVILDCDLPTAKWYEQHKGIDQKAKTIVVVEPEPPKKPIPVPPHSGIGSEEDTLASWKHLIPRKPKIDFMKFRARTGKTVKFTAKLVTTDPINSERVFRITYYLDDDDLAVYEPPVRNSGVAAGVFQKKKKMKNAETGKDFCLADFVVGGTVTMKGHKFLITAIEAQPKTVIPEVGAVLKALKGKLIDASASLRKMFRKFDLDHSQTMSFDEFFNMLNYYSLGLTKYEAIVLFKTFEDAPGFMSYENFMQAFDQKNDDVTLAGGDGDGGAGGAGVTVADKAKAMHSNMSEEDLDALIAEARAHEARATTLAEADVLLARIARNLKNSKGSTMMHENFRRFDVNKDHLISKEEFANVMGSKAGGLNLTPKEVDMLIGKFFYEDDGTELENLDYMKFMHTIHVYADKVRGGRGREGRRGGGGVSAARPLPHLLDDAPRPVHRRSRSHRLSLLPLVVPSHARRSSAPRRALRAPPPQPERARSGRRGGG